MTVTPVLVQNKEELKLAIENVRDAHKRFAKYVRGFYRNVKETDSTMIGETLRAFKFYPPPVPNPTYRRTFRLKKSWRIKPEIQTYTGVIGADSGVEYAQKVMGVYQNTFFASRGWVNSPTLAEANHPYAERELMDLWTDVTVGF